METSGWSKNPEDYQNPRWVETSRQYHEHMAIETVRRMVLHEVSTHPERFESSVEWSEVHRDSADILEPALTITLNTEDSKVLINDFIGKVGEELGYTSELIDKCKF